MKKEVLAVLMWAFVVQGYASAADWFVDQASPGAVHDGKSQATAFTSIMPCITAAQPGDVCFISPGVYDEALTIKKDNLTIRSAGTTKPVINQDIVLDPANYFTIEGMYMNSSDIRVQSGHHNRIIGNHFHQVGVRSGWHNYFAILLGGHSNLAANNTIYKPQMGIVVSGQDNVVENNEVDSLKRWIGTDCDYMRLFGSGHVVRGNYLHGTDFNETGGAHVDCFQTFDDNGYQQCGSTLNDVIIEKNTCMNTHQALMFESRYCNASGNITIRNNIFMGPIMAGYFYNMGIYNNVFTEIGYNAIGSLAECSNNIFYNINFISGDTPYACASGRNNLIYSHVSRYYSPAKFPLDIFWQDPKFANAPRGCRFASWNSNNMYDGDESSFEVSDAHLSTFIIGEYIEYCPGATCDGITRRITGISGNLVQFTPPISDYHSPACGQIYEDYCGINIRLWGDNGADWTLDYRLQPGSPAIDAGFALPYVSEDLEGTLRPQGNGWDMGAYEYVSGSACAPIHAADSNPCDGCISTDEMLSYIHTWKTSSTALGELMQAIAWWKNGC